MHVDLSVQNADIRTSTDATRGSRPVGAMGLRIETHAQGEEPIGIVLAGVERARSKNPQAQLRAPASSTAAS